MVDNHNVCLHVLCRCGVEDFKRSADTWRSRAESAAVLRSEFADMLGEADDGAAADNLQGEIIE